MLRKSFKEIVQKTNQEFCISVMERLPFVGSIVLLIFSVTLLVYAYNLGFFIGLSATPFILAGSMWGLLFINNLYCYRKPH